MCSTDDDKERGRLILEKRRKWATKLVSPRTLKAMLTVGPWIVSILRLILELVKLLKG